MAEVTTMAAPKALVEPRGFGRVDVVLVPFTEREGMTLSACRGDHRSWEIVCASGDIIARARLTAAHMVAFTDAVLAKRIGMTHIPRTSEKDPVMHVTYEAGERPNFRLVLLTSHSTFIVTLSEEEGLTWFRVIRRMTKLDRMRVQPKGAAKV